MFPSMPRTAASRDLWPWIMVLMEQCGFYIAAQNLDEIKAVRRDPERLLREWWALHTHMRPELHYKPDLNANANANANPSKKDTR